MFDLLRLALTLSFDDENTCFGPGWPRREAMAAATRALNAPYNNTFGATETGVYTIQARVKAVTAQIQVAYRNPDQSDALQIYNLNPA